MAIERSVDGGKTFTPWQYFSKNCTADYGLPNRALLETVDQVGAKTLLLLRPQMENETFEMKSNVDRRVCVRARTRQSLSDAEQGFLKRLVLNGHPPPVRRCNMLACPICSFRALYTAAHGIVCGDGMFTRNLPAYAPCDTAVRWYALTSSPASPPPTRAWLSSR